MPRGTVLLVGAGADVREAVKATLSHLSYNVIEVDAQEEAIRLVAGGRDLFMVDAVICDVRLPMTSGGQAVTYCRSHIPFSPIILLTNSLEPTKASQLFKLGVADYLVKPVRPCQLEAVLDELSKRSLHTVHSDAVCQSPQGSRAS